MVSTLQDKESSLNDFYCSVGRAKFPDRSYSTHKDPVVKRWLERHPPCELHFTANGSSWMNLVERFFRDLSLQAILPGGLGSALQLVEAIMQYLAQHNLESQALCPEGLKERRSYVRSSEPRRCPLARITLHHYFGDAGLEKLASFDGSTVAVYGRAAKSFALGGLR